MNQEQVKEFLLSEDFTDIVADLIGDYVAADDENAMVILRKYKKELLDRAIFMASDIYHIKIFDLSLAIQDSELTGEIIGASAQKFYIETTKTEEGLRDDLDIVETFDIDEEI